MADPNGTCFEDAWCFLIKQEGGKPSDTWVCPRCGRRNDIYPYSTRCSRCGYLRKVEKQEPDKTNPSIKTKVTCPLCHDVITGEIDDQTRSDVLIGHIISYHGSKAMPTPPHEGPPLPRGLGIKWPWKR